MNEHFLTEIEIKQFKCFFDFKASGFKRVNLIGGKNNIGKTALMEAFYINLRGDSVDQLIMAVINSKFMRENINFVGRELKHPENSISFLNSVKFYNAKSNVNESIFNIIEEDAKKEYCFNINNKEISVNANDIYINAVYRKNINFIDSFGLSEEQLAKNYEFIQRNEKENYLSTLVQEFDDSIESFKLLGGTKPECKTKGRWFGITEFGDGLRHYISIICALYACESGYLFIDEIDNGIYYEHFDRLWEIILTLSKQTNCQVFATTHSKEMLESFARVAKKQDEQDISFTTLIKNKNQEIKTITRDYEMILGSIEDEREVR
jgi:AAA15 family ATPase/GTPase